MNFDRDHSGTVEPHELQQCLVAFGYNLSPQAMGVLLRRYSNDGRIGFDDFVSLCVRLRALTCEYSTPRISDVCGENDITATSCSSSMHINIHILHYNSIIHQIVLREFIVFHLCSCMECCYSVVDYKLALQFARKCNSRV